MNAKNKKVIQNKKQQKKLQVNKKQTKKVNQISKNKVKKKHVRKIRYGRVLLYLILPVILIVIVASCIHFPIKNIFVTGNSILSDQEIIELAGISNYPSIFEYTTWEMSDKIKKNKYIDSVKIKKKKLKEIHIEVVENIPILYDSYSNKTIYSNKKQYNGNDSACTLLNYTPESYFDDLVKGLTSMNRDVRERISEIQYVPNNVDEKRFIFTMNDGNYVYITLSKIEIMNTYIDIIKNIDGKRGILYLDSGGYFEIKE